MQKLLRENHEVLLMNCTYKINKYKMPLLIITGVTSLNTTFYVGFLFMKGEHYSDYVWALKALKRLYNHFNLQYPETVLSDGDKLWLQRFLRFLKTLLNTPYVCGTSTTTSSSTARSSLLQMSFSKRL